MVPEIERELVVVRPTPRKSLWVYVLTWESHRLRMT